jgi:alkylation response protein AidB-like acyl-CoA dehydrogenase
LEKLAGDSGAIVAMSSSVDFSEDQLAFSQLAQDFAHTEVLPCTALLELGDLPTIQLLWDKLSEAGFTGLTVPEAYGGADVDAASLLLVLQALAQVSAGLATSLSVHTGLGSMPILWGGSPALKDEILPRVASGQCIVAFGLTEPNAGSDAGAGAMRADRDGDHYVMNGGKVFITNAHCAGGFVVTARTNVSDAGPKGLSAFWVPANTPGLTIAKADEKSGQLGSEWGNLFFEGCRIPALYRLGDEGEGFKLFMRGLDSGRLSIAAISLGLAEACLSASVAYTQQREQFGRRISQFQAIQFKLADMATDIEAARHLVYTGAKLKQVGVPYTREAAMAKLYASELANRCANQAVQILGGYGYTKDFPVERYFRDARVLTLYEGTSEVQRLVIGRTLLAD